MYTEVQKTEISSFATAVMYVLPTDTIADIKRRGASLCLVCARFRARIPWY
jgi:hypothetical protein